MKPLKIFSGFLILLVVFQCGQASINVEELLEKAEKVKISDQNQFESIINNLINHKNDLSEGQKEELSYLLIFQEITTGEYDKSILLLNNLQTKTRNFKLKIRAHVTLSSLYAFKGSYEKAFNSLKFIADNIEDIQDPELKILAYLAIANTYSLTGQYELSKKFSKYLLNQELDDYTICKAKTLYIISSIKSNADFFPDSEINSIVELCTENGEAHVGIFMKLNWIAYQIDQMNKPFDKGRLENFLNTLNQDNKINTGYVLKSVELIELSLIAQIHWMLAQFSEAEQFALQVINSPDTMGDNEPRIIAYKVLKDLANESGDHEKAYLYLSKLSEIEAAFHQDNQMKQMAFMNVQHANLAREVENQQLSETNKLLQVEQSLAAQKALNQKLIVALLLFALSVLAYALFRMKVRHIELESLVVMDHLTKVLNRKGFELQINELLSEAQSSEMELHLAILDLDHFKLVNDEHGHLTGDWVLKHVIYEVKKHIGSNMFIGRLGGEEFGILGKNLTSKAMDERLEAIRESIAQLDCSASEHDINVTASIGVTSCELSGYTMQMLLAHADLALYQAKSGGRNQVVRYHYLQ